MNENIQKSSFSSPAIYREKARTVLQGSWNQGALITLVYAVVSIVASSFPEIGGIISLIVTGPLVFGLTMYFLRLSRKQPVEIKDLFFGFTRFGQTLVTYLLMVLFIILWSLLLIIPGIIAALSYGMTFYLLIDKPDLKPMDALKRSKEMMYGHKMDFFMLVLSFIGWALLSALTLGIGFLWLTPYIQVSVALFYQDVRDNQNLFS
ncbi:MAG: DUF975 family protein [Chitinivibrionales bacterium]